MADTGVRGRRASGICGVGIIETFGAVHVVCNNAGIGPLAPVADLTLDDWRWMIGVNLWGVIHGVHTFLPILRQNRCDARSVAAQDKQYCEITMKSAAGDLLTWENITYYHNDAHRWWYCQDMTRDEAYVFRSFDSAQTEPVPHSAFVNECCPASAPPRASVEVRVFAFYED